MLYVPLNWGTRDSVAKIERKTINELQAPMQDRARVVGFRPSRYRPWPHLRGKNSLEKEEQLNIHIAKHDVERQRLPGLPNNIFYFVTSASGG